MQVYGLKYREKGSKDYVSLIFFCKDQAQLKTDFEKYIEEEMIDLDKRTVSWAGNSIPLSSKGPIAIYANLDDLT